MNKNKRLVNPVPAEAGANGGNQLQSRRRFVRKTTVEHQSFQTRAIPSGRTKSNGLPSFRYRPRFEVALAVVAKRIHLRRRQFRHIRHRGVETKSPQFQQRKKKSPNPNFSPIEFTVRFRK